MIPHEDYFAPTKWEPPPPREPWRPSRGLIVALLVLILLGAVAFAGLKVRSYFQARAAQTRTDLVVKTPAAKVLVGKPLRWRTLATWDKPTDWKHPLPELVVDDFTADRQADLLLVDFSNHDASRIFQPDGTFRKVRGKWDLVTRFYSWDFDQDGIAELIPHAVTYALVPATPARLMVTRLCGG